MNTSKLETRLASKHEVSVSVTEWTTDLMSTIHTLIHFTLEGAAFISLGWISGFVPGCKM